MRSAEALAALLIARIDAISQAAGHIESDEITKVDGLKSRIIEDPLISVDISAEDTFEVEGNPQDICISILRDYYFGWKRVQQQWQSTVRLAEDQNHVAWTVVSSYYCAYFCALEILRIHGRFPLSLAEDSAGAMFGRATGVKKSEFLQKKHTNFIGYLAPDFSKITYKASGIRPHQFAWQEFSNSIFSKFPNRISDWDELHKFQNICSGRRGWQTPSEIRNRWNYRDSLYFSSLGISSAQPFLKLLANPGSSSKWIRQVAKANSEADCISSLAAITQFLFGAVHESYTDSLASIVNF